MAYITLLSYSVLSFLLIAISADIQDIKVDKYYVHIYTYPIDDSFYVDSFIFFTNLRTTQEISLYTNTCSEINFNRNVSVRNTDNNKYLNYRGGGHITDNTTNNFTYLLEEEMDPGPYMMNYTSWKRFNKAFDQVYFDRHEKEVMWLSSTHFLPIGIHKIIPCWIKPKEDTSLLDMPTFNLSISHFAYHSVLTNMPIREKRESTDAQYRGMQRTYFDITPRMSPYQLSIIVTNFTRTVIDEDDAVSMWCRNRSASSLKFALTIARNITTYLQLNTDELLRCRFSTTRVKLIVIPKIQSSSNKSFPERNDSLVHPGIIIANEDDIIYNEEDGIDGRKYNVIRLLGYELMRQYYEWIVNPYLPSTWLSKGFATFIATHNFDQISPNLRMMDLFVVQILHECLDFDVDNRMLPFHQQYKTIPVEIIDNMRASVILRMLQHSCDYQPGAFWKAINRFMYESVSQRKKHHLKTFWRIIKEEVNYKNYDTRRMMDPWVKGKGYPVLTVNRKYTSETGNRIVLSLREIEFWKIQRPIPMTLTGRSLINSRRKAGPIWYLFNDVIYEYEPPIEKESWVIYNVEQTGYYRVHYDDENWARISKYLNGEDYWKIHVLNRAQLIDDAFQFMLWGKLKADIFWQLTKYLERERDYIAWYPMFKAIQYMSTSLHFYREFYPVIRPKIVKMMTTLLQDINYEEQPTDNDFTKMLRQEAVQWACSLNSFRCFNMANTQLKNHLIDFHTKLSPWWKKWTYCYGLIRADDITWHQTLNKIKGNDNDKILYLLTCPNHLLELLEKNIYKLTTYTNAYVKSHTNSSTIVQLELKYFGYLIGKCVKDDQEYYYGKVDYSNHTRFKLVLDNFDTRPRQLKLSTALVILLSNIFSKDHLHDVWNSLHIFKGISKSLIEEKIQERETQLETHLSFFTRIKPRN